MDKAAEDIIIERFKERAPVVWASPARQWIGEELRRSIREAVEVQQNADLAVLANRRLHAAMLGDLRVLEALDTVMQRIRDARYTLESKEKTTDVYDLSTPEGYARLVG